MTLIEIVIAVGILGVVIGPIMISFLLGILEAQGTRDRIADSSSAQVTSAYLLSDIQSSQDVATSGSACLPSPFVVGTDTVVLQLTWSDPGVSDDTVVSYIDHPAGGQRELHRAACSTASGNESTLLVQHLDAFTPTCSPSPCTATPSAPDEVDISITAKNANPQEGSSYSAFTFEIEAIRRVGE